MIGDRSQTQTAGDHSNNIQAQNVYVTGLSATEAREIALDVFKANFLTLSKDAVDTALARAEALNASFIEKSAQGSDPSVFDELRSPGMQLTLLSAQKEYARTGEKITEDLLVSLLSERLKTKQRNLRQIAIEEAVSVVSKLTDKQVDILTLNVLLNDHYLNPPNEQTLKHYVSEIVQFKAEINWRSADISHLQFTGCAIKAQQSQKGLDLRLKTIYPGLFPKGFSLEEFSQKIPGHEEFLDLLLPHPHMSGKLMFNCPTVDGINAFFSQRGLDNSRKKPLFDFQREGSLSTKEIQSYLSSIDPQIEFIFKFDNHSVRDIELTPVGMAIAAANYQRRTGRYLHWPYYLSDSR